MEKKIELRNVLELELLRYFVVSNEKIENALKQSILTFGLLQLPIVCGNRVISGSNIVKVCKELVQMGHTRFEKIGVLVIYGLSEEEQIKISLLMTVIRFESCYYEIANFVSNLVKKYGLAEIISSLNLGDLNIDEMIKLFNWKWPDKEEHISHQLNEQFNIYNFSDS